MPTDWYLDVYAFHEKFGCQIGDAPAAPDPQTAELRKKLIDEEVAELHAAQAAGDLPGIADAIVDSIYVLLGYAISYGIDVRPIWDEVQRANMSKEGGGTRADGKIMKPEGWQPPDIEGHIERQMAGANA